MSNFTVLRVRQLTRGALVGADSHQMRKSAAVHIDESRSVFNKVLVGSGDIEGDALEILNRVPLANSKTTLVAAEMILSAHHEYFDRISPKWRQGEISPAMQKWIDKSLQFLRKEYGQGLASVTLHLDENAPHLHCVIVPVTTYDIGYRRGAKSVTRVNYRRLFFDDQKVLNAAQQANRSDTDTKLGRLQTRYAEAVGGMGLSRGLRNSKATHQEIREFQRMLKEPAPVALKHNFTTEAPKPGQVEIALPEVPSITNRSEVKIRQAMVESATAGFSAFGRANQPVINALFAKAKHYDHVADENRRLKTLVKTSDEKAVAMEDKITQLTDELALTKAEIAKLRAIDVQRVAEAIGYTGPMKWKNAIDLVKDVEGMDYKQAVAWLHAEFGLDAAAATAADFQREVVNSYIEQKPAVPLTKQQVTKAQRVTEQLRALGAERYRITMMSDLHPTYNVGKGRGEGGAEKLYTATEVAAMVPQLERKNQKEKYNVFVTPISDTQHYVLVDDLAKDTLDAMRTEGYRPNVLLESSRGNMQAVFIVPKTEMSKELGNAVFKGLNEQYGDQNIQGFVHPFRLAGFANVKDKHRDEVRGHYPFVRLVERVKGTCGRLMDLARLIADQTAKPHITEAQAAAGVRKLLMAQGTMHALVYDPASAAPEALKRMATAHYQWCTWRWGPDMNRSTADFMLIKRAAASGYSEVQIATTLALVSPDLASRHQDVVRYLNESLGAAAEMGYLEAPR